MVCDFEERCNGGGHSDTNVQEDPSWPREKLFGVGGVHHQDVPLCGDGHARETLRVEHEVRHWQQDVDQTRHGVVYVPTELLQVLIEKNIQSGQVEAWRCLEHIMSLRGGRSEQNWFKTSKYVHLEIASLLVLKLKTLKNVYSMRNLFKTCKSCSILDIFSLLKYC